MMIDKNAEHRINSSALPHTQRSSRPKKAFQETQTVVHAREALNSSRQRVSPPQIELNRLTALCLEGRRTLLQCHRQGYYWGAPQSDRDPVRADKCNESCTFRSKRGTSADLTPFEIRLVYESSKL